MHYRVVWALELQANSPLEAVEKARKYHSCPSLAFAIYDVTDANDQKTRVDLLEEKENGPEL